jgi:predicted nucleotidyltransferase component of viral defense system
MDKAVRFSPDERSGLFTQTAANMGITPALVEKDFWVSWVLKRLYQHDELARLLLFKGGTSLSKAYKLINRFSEDIDLVLDWRVLKIEDPMGERSKTKQEKLNDAIDERAQEYIRMIILNRHAIHVIIMIWQNWQNRQSERRR